MNLLLLSDIAMVVWFSLSALMWTAVFFIGAEPGTWRPLLWAMASVVMAANVLIRRFGESR